MRALILSLLLTYCWCGYAQKCRVKFIVIDNFTKQRLPDVRVIYKSKTTCNTDSRGECVSEELGKGDHYFTFEKPGYEPLESYMVYAVADTTVTEPVIKLARETYTRNELAAAVQLFAAQNRTWIQRGDTATLRKIYDTSLARFINETLILQHKRNNNKRGLLEYMSFVDTLFKNNRLAFVRKEEQID